MISVIIPTYQCARTIFQCLERLLLQRGAEFEIIIVDDGSTDDTLSLLGPYRDRVSVLSQDHRGASAARNAGARIAHGRYLFFCDADVILEPNALAIMLETLTNNPQSAYVYCPFKFGRRLMNSVRFNAEWLRRFNYISTMSLIRQPDFPGFDESLKRFQDWDLWLTLLKRGKTGTLTPKPLFQTLDRPGISGSRIGQAEAELIIRIKHKLTVPSFGQRIVWRIGFALYTIWSQSLAR